MSPRRHHIDSSATVERSLRLDDEAAQKWFAQRGQRAAGRAPFRVFVDGASGSGLALTRIWHSPATVSREPLTGEGLTVLIQVDGTVDLELLHTKSSLSISPGGAVLIPDGAPYVLTAGTSTARIEIGLRHSLGLINEDQVISWDHSPYIRVLVAAVNAFLSAPTVDPASAGYAHLKSAIRGLLFASITSASVSASDNLRGSAAVLFQRAQAVIARDAVKPEFRAQAVIARDAVKPEFRVADLANELRVSQVYLRRVFGDAGTSPLKAIRDARVRNARVHLQHTRPHPSQAELQKIARAAGFSTVRHMRDSLASTPDPPQNESGTSTDTAFGATAHASTEIETSIGRQSLQNHARASSEENA